MYSPAKSRPSRGVLGLLLSPAIIAVAQAQALAAWASSQALEALLLPKRAAVACLYIANVGSGDLLAYLTAQPTSKMQVCAAPQLTGPRARRARAQCRCC